jgi:hypothetical protein
MSQINVGNINATGGLYLPQHTDASRPTNQIGLMIFNIDSGTVQFFDGADWQNISTFRDQSFSNIAVFDYSGGDQIWQVPTNVRVREFQVLMWGAGGGADEGATASGGSGGFTSGIISRFDGADLNGTSFTIVAGQGGARGSGSTDTRTSYGGGGKGSVDSGGGHVSGGGGGLSGIFAGPNSVFGGAEPLAGAHARSILIAGGGGGANDQATGTAYGGGGGGLEGGRGGSDPQSTNKGGWGGRQVAGYSGTNDATNEVDGGPLRGGDGVTGGDNPGGGGGYYGGQSGGDDNSGSGGGSGYIGGTSIYQVTSATTNIGAFGTSINFTYTPSNSDNPNYSSGIGVASSTTTGGNGRVVIIY